MAPGEIRDTNDNALPIVKAEQIKRASESLGRPWVKLPIAVRFGNDGRIEDRGRCVGCGACERAASTARRRPRTTSRRCTSGSPSSKSVAARRRWRRPLGRSDAKRRAATQSSRRTNRSRALRSTKGQRDEDLEQLAVGREAIGGVQLSELCARASWLTVAAHLAAGDAAAALDEASQARAFLRPEACVGDYTRSGIHQVCAEALLEGGREDEGKEALRHAVDRLRNIRDALPGPLGAAYLDGIEAHRRTMELAAEWLD